MVTMPQSHPDETAQMKRLWSMRWNRAPVAVTGSFSSLAAGPIPGVTRARHSGRTPQQAVRLSYPRRTRDNIAATQEFIEIAERGRRARPDVAHAEQISGAGQQCDEDAAPDPGPLRGIDVAVDSEAFPTAAPRLPASADLSPDLRATAARSRTRKAALDQAYDALGGSVHPLGPFGPGVRALPACGVESSDPVGTVPRPSLRASRSRVAAERAISFEDALFDWPWQRVAVARFIHDYIETITLRTAPGILYLSSVGYGLFDLASADCRSTCG